MSRARFKKKNHDLKKETTKNYLINVKQEKFFQCFHKRIAVEKFIFGICWIHLFRDIPIAVEHVNLFLGIESYSEYG